MTMHEERRPVEPQDLFRLTLLQGARVSPDASTVVYAASTIRQDGPAKEDAKDGEEKEYVALWLLNLHSSQVRQLTTGLAKDSNAQWSPDDSQIAFLSTRDEKPQIYTIPVSGGEARRVTFLKQGAGGGAVWSPDGQRLAFAAPADADPPDRDRPYRITRNMYRFDAAGYLDGVAHDIWVVDVAGGEPRKLTDDGCQNSMPVWSPDGSELLYLASLFPDEYRMYARLRAVNLDGNVREIIGDRGNVLAMTWTPDGQQIVYIGGAHGRPIGSKQDLWVVDRAGGTPVCRTTSLPNGVGGSLQPDMAAFGDIATAAILVTADATAAFVQSQEGGTVRIVRVALRGQEEVVPVVTGDRACVPLDLVGDKLLFAASRLDNPADLYCCTGVGSDEQQLTHLNDDVLSTLELPAVEHLQFHGTDGVPVEGWLLKPSHGQAPYPTILYIHGGPHSGFGHMFSFDFQMLAGAGYAVLFVNQRGSTGYGDAFATAIIGDWGNLDYGDLMAGVDAAVAQGLADPERLGVCGLSGGGNLSSWIVGQTARFKAAVPENPVTNWVSFYGVSDIGPWFAVEELGGKPHEIPEVYRRCSPITYAHRCTTPTLLVQGEADYRCPAEQSEQFFAVLKANGCPVEMLRLPASSHAGSIRGDLALRRAQNDALLEWMNRYVLADPSS
ncbi:MAG: S9 family peptidase [Herpetosiphonaceae bacterium]|nr:S9 family peptidase [Herpetosiphonaceae bacterium]